MHALALAHQLDAFMHQALGIHARGDTGLAQHVDGALFQYAGADSAQHVLGGLAFEDDVVDAGLVQQLAQQKAGRACSDDGDLSVHLLFSLLFGPATIQAGTGVGCQISPAFFSRKTAKRR
ncbi:hypothetical protein D3C78_647550 [compost metagenome]